MKAKRVRHAKIKELLERDHVDTHQKMATALAVMEIEVSQSTLSKDLRELGVVRVPRPEGGFRYALGGVGATLHDRRILERELQDYLLEVDRVGNMALLKTVSGHAQSVCEAIDRMGWEEVMGTLAGDNTIFALTRTPEAAARFVALIAGEVSAADRRT